MTYEPDYAQDFKERVDEARKLANQARKKGGDPTDHVEIPGAEDMAERCEVLLEREYGDKIHGLAKQIREIEADDEVDGREEMSLVLAEEFAQGELSKDFDNDAERVEAAIRTSIAILTEGVVAAPIEGMGEVSIDDNDDGSKFIRVPYFGPIRSAGGTAQAVSVLVADYVRELLGISEFQPRDDEVERYTEEIHLYNNAVGMQYCPPKDKCRYIIRHVPIMVDGIPNSNAVKREVDGYRDLERIDGNHPRDGMALVVAEGIGLKAPKLQRYSEAFGLESWDWLDKFIDGGGDDEEDEESGEENTELKTTVPTRTDEITALDPSTKYLGDVIAGRPIIGDPAEPGGFRLRYGRSRTAGHAAVGFSPASMHILNDFIAPSTQIKTERPGKAAGATPVDSLEGPTVRLETGELRRIDDIEEAKELHPQVEEILDLGEIGIPFGEFVENNHPLAPASYTKEWWEIDLEENDGNPEDIEFESVTVQEAIKLSEKYNIPLHPEYTYLWHDINPEEYSALRGALNEAQTKKDTVTLPRPIYKILEKLLVPHQLNDENVTLNSDIHNILEHCVSEQPIDDDVLGQVNQSAPFTVRARAITRIGGRMGRPEKAERREMKPYIHSLFPIGPDAGGMQHQVEKAAQYTKGGNKSFDKKDDQEYDGKGTIKANVTHRVCPECNNTTWRMKCPHDGTKTNVTPVCNNCSNINDKREIGDACRKCGQGTYKETNYRKLDINEAFNSALDNVGERTSSIDTVKSLERLPSDSKIPEPLEKGILRGKYDVSVFRDGTARYDMCDLPLTSFKPEEIGITVEQVKELGYTQTVEGEPITSEDDLIELKIQDVIVNERAGEYLLNVAKYVDDLLVQYYDEEPYYNAETPNDLIGSLMLGMAPHTSAAVVGRLIGYTRASANYAHPFFHAAKRRNCFHENTELNVKINGEWQKEKIGNLVNDHLIPDIADDSYDDGSIVQSIKDHPDIEEMKVPSMNDEGQRTIENVTHLSKHKAPEHMVTIETDDGEELTVTPDHTIPVKGQDDVMTEKKAHEIEEGDKLFDYNRDIVNNVKNYTEVDLVKELLTLEHDIDLENVMIRGIDKDDTYAIFSDALEEDDDDDYSKLQTPADYLGMNKKTVSNYVYRNSIPLSIIQKLYPNSNIENLLEIIPKNVEIGMKRDNVESPRFITIDEELACLIGYYTAEGYTRVEYDDRADGEHISSTHVDFAATETQAREFIKDTLNKKFNVENAYTNKPSRITASGNIVRFFFRYVLNSGRVAHLKEVPELIKNSIDEIKGAYLSGYLSGDGEHVKSKLRATTTSEQLKEDLIDLYKSMGYSTTVYEAPPVKLNKKFPDYYDEDCEKLSRVAYKIKFEFISDAREFSRKYGVQLTRKEGNENKEFMTNTVINKSYDKTNVQNTYNLTVEYTNKLEVCEHMANQCDGDEDSVMLLMDGFLNFSRDYLPSQRGKNMMDAPIVMSSVIDPEEIDDEAHNVDVVDKYPKEFYEATMHAASPDDIDIELAEDRLDNPTGFKSTLPTSQLDAGPKLTAYKTLGGMQEKLDAQLALAEASRCVDEKRVASLVVEKHFFPDIIGNLTAFSRQQFLCGACGEKHRRAPASGRCLKDGCPGGVRLTVYEGMVTKYVDMATTLAETYSLRDYDMQRLYALSDVRIPSIFEDDKEEQVTLDDYF